MSALANDTDEIEGIAKDEDAGLGDYPIDTFLIRNEARTVHDVTRRIDGGSYIMNPDFQRDFIWPDDKQSKLIESVLMRIPLPVFYLAEDANGHMIVVDGLQRLSTFSRFLKNKLQLTLPKQVELHKKRFRDLSAKLQNRVEDCNLVLYIIDAKVPERARLDIFDRVNGGVPLTRQQMRNCLYTGQATLFVKKEAEEDSFIKATGGSLPTRTMRDREFVNRFCAFHLLPVKSYRDDMDAFLANALEDMNKMDATALGVVSVEFRNALRNNLSLFGDHAFRKHHPGQPRRGILNASLWDVMSTGLARIHESAINAHGEKLKERFYKLMDDEEFIHSITYGTNASKEVRHRFEVMTKTLREVFDADAP